MLDQKQRFTEIFNKNLFRVGVPNLSLDGSVSGGGSDLTICTEVIRKELPNLFKELNIKTMLDAPCGDFNWMKEVDLTNVDYIGMDIVDQIIDDNVSRYTKPNITFMSANIIEDELPTTDLVLCRDCLVHLMYEDIFKALSNFKKSGSKYLLTTTFPLYKQQNRELGGIWRALNLEESPFHLPKPIKYIIESSSGNTSFGEKTLALWHLDKLSGY